MNFFRHSPCTPAVFVLVALLLQACASDGVNRDEHFRMEPLEIPTSDDDETETLRRQKEAEQPSDELRTRLQSETGPSAPGSSDHRLTGEQSAPAPDELTGEPIQLSVNNLPLPVFINEVFGEKLGLSYTLTSGLSERSDLVTLRLNEPLPPAALFRTARSVLAEYGVAITEREDVWTFSLSEDVATEGLPLLVTGETLPDVPVSHRPVFQMIELKVVRNAQVRSLVQGLFRGQDVEVMEDAMRNAIMLKGPADQVAEAAATVEFFDRPVLKGRNSLLLRPVYRDITPLTQALEDVLSAQGYALGSAAGSSGSIILLPMPEMGVIVALANDSKTLAHVNDWATRLDRDYQREIESGMFLYEVQNTSAANLANLVSQLYVGGSNRSDAGSGSADGNGNGDDDSSGSSSRGGNRPSASSQKVADGRLVVDEKRNVLIYRGSGHNWLEIREIIEALDKQVPSVLLEVLLAEVTLNENEGMGVEWLARSAPDDFDATFGTLGGLGIGGRGFSYTLNSAGQTRAVLNAFYDSNQAVIRSSPKIMVKSGEEARIEVGNEIPILTSTRQGDFQTGGDTDVLQQFQFRKTGVVLSVRPVVQASGLVDIQIDQNLSETQDTGSGDTFLPTILNRSVQTSLTLRDGGSVVLGGLISRTTSTGEQGIPMLGRLPGLGRLFRTESDNSSVTELMIMVVPYVIRDDNDAQNISERLREQLRHAEAEGEQPSSASSN